MDPFTNDEIHAIVHQMILLHRSKEEIEDSDTFINLIWNHGHLDTLTSYRCLSYLYEIGIIKDVNIIRKAPPTQPRDSSEP